MAYEQTIQLATIVFSILVAFIVFFTFWNGRWEVLNTLYSAAAGVLALAVLLLVGLVVLLAFAMAGMGFLISSGARSALEAIIPK